MIQEILQKVISEKFKPVAYLVFEEDRQTDGIPSGEFSFEKYPAIMHSKEFSSSKKRYPIVVKIRFSDNTGFSMKLLPEDYLAGAKTREFSRDLGYGCSSLVKAKDRRYDYDKILKTILNKLNKEENYNPTFETLDSLLECPLPQ